MIKIPLLLILKTHVNAQQNFQPPSYEELQNEAFQLHEQLVDYRRHLHKNPELGFAEYETSKFIQSKLFEFGLEYTTGWGKNTNPKYAGT